MMVKQHGFWSRLSRGLDVLMSATLCPMIPVSGFSQEESTRVSNLINKLRSPSPITRFTAMDNLGRMVTRLKMPYPLSSRFLKKLSHLFVLMGEAAKDHEGVAAT